LHGKFDIGLAKKCLVLERRWRLTPVVTMSQVHITGCAVAGFWRGTRAAAASIKVFGANFVLLESQFMDGRLESPRRGRRE
jgi:hypothetical protein